MKGNHEDSQNLCHTRCLFFRARVIMSTVGFGIHVSTISDAELEGNLSRTLLVLEPLIGHFTLARQCCAEAD
jgi:hypothetical protein